MKAWTLVPLLAFSATVSAQAPDEHAGPQAAAAPEAQAAPQAEPVDHAGHLPAPAQDEHAGHVPAQAGDEHAAHLPAPVTTPAPLPYDSAAKQEARHMSMMMHGDSLNYLLLGERIEYNEDAAFIWEAQGWIGRDLDKLWVKTEGHYDTDANRSEELEVQALYSRAVAPFWDLQAGLRHDDVAGSQRGYAVLGLMGLAPYWFEIDSALFLSERGDLGARLEAEYDLRFTQRLLLQPRLELNYSFADDPAMGIGKGLSSASVGLRLRYEFRREFAPYLGVEWSRAYGNTAGLLRMAAEQREELSAVVGLRVWY